ncbi:MAG: arsenate reductase ArsC [Gammaproteobacteria bacterium]|nr:arsenate reductase ArsC [Gammaproteobacteria bacterium]
MKNVLFICVENSCRSQMAEAFGNMYGQEIIKPYSSGTRPSGIVNPKAIKSMQEVGYDLSVHSSKALSEIPDMEYALLVTMGCGDACPNIKASERQDWDIPDPKHMDMQAFAEVRDLICEKVKDLIEWI